LAFDRHSIASTRVGLRQARTFFWTAKLLLVNSTVFTYWTLLHSIFWKLLQSIFWLENFLRILLHIVGDDLQLEAIGFIELAVVVNLSKWDWASSEYRLDEARRSKQWATEVCFF